LAGSNSDNRMSKSRHLPAKTLNLVFTWSVLILNISTPSGE
jgi:hypothetical protein